MSEDDDVTPIQVELTLLGFPTLTVGSHENEGSIGPGKSLALLAYLAVRRQVRRDELISLLWGDMPEERARNAFRQSLHRIRNTIGKDRLPADRDTLGLDPTAGVRVDRDLFLAAIETERWEDAAQLYRGDFLEGFELGETTFDRWAGNERMQLRSRFHRALRESGDRSLRNGDTSAAIQYAARLSTSAPYEADAAVFHANVLLAGGKASDALNSLRQFSVRLRTELEVEPPAAVQTLMTRLERNAESQAASLENLRPAERKGHAFVGRERELAKLLAGIVAARSERGSTLVLESDAGMGRSRLLDEVRSRARDLGGITVLRGRERATTSVVPYAGIAEALRPLARAPGIAGASKHLLAEAARLLPELRDSFELPVPEPLEDAAGRLRFFEGVAATIDAAAYEQPLCIMLDDLHHASGPSLDLLAYLTARLRTSPVAFVLSLRADRSGVADRVRAMAQASDEDSSDGVLLLEPLSVDETRALVDQIVVGLGATNVDVERVVRQSKGRPVLAIDLARRAAAGETTSESPILMRDVLWGRLQAATPSQRRLFFAAVLIERVAPIRLLAAAAHLPEAAALEAAIDLSRAGLLRDEGTGYAVAHDSTTSFVVDASGLAGRALLAGWAADALAAEEPGADAELSALYAMAGRGALTFAHARTAAFSAAAVGATAEAMHHLSVALSFAPDERARAQIESLLAVYGPGTLRLPAPESEQRDKPGATDLPTRDAGESGDASDTPPHVSNPNRSTPIVDAAPVRRRASPHQWYMSIALSAIVILLGILVRRQLRQTVAPAANADSVVVAHRDAATGDTALFSIPFQRSGNAPPQLSPTTTLNHQPAWIRSVPAPWADPRVSPDGHRVALAKVTAHGRDLYVVSADQRDTTPLAIDGGDNAALGWSPDSRSLLVVRSRTLADGSYDSDLFAYRVERLPHGVPIDTSSSRSITDAQWSPTGLQIAWVARVGSTRQRDIFVSDASGSNGRNITSSSSDDFEPTWSPDGSLLAFTSARTGGNRLFTYDFENAKVWAVSDRDGEDHPRFSPDGRVIAFESHQDGAIGVYYRPALGGAARRVTPTGSDYELAGWTPRAPAWIERVRILGATSLTVGDSSALSLLTLRANGTSASGVAVTWSVLDSGSSPVSLHRNPESHDLTVVADRVGIARLVATIPGWRSDTLPLVVASAALGGFVDSFGGGIDAARWLALGEPAPYVGADPSDRTRRALFPNGDLEWDSGLLSRSAFALAPGLRMEARIHAPYAGRASAAVVSVGFVGALSAADARSPQPEMVVGVTWDGQSGGFRYVAGRESFSDLAAARTDSSSHFVAAGIGTDGVVVFSVDGRERWRSSLRFASDATRPRAQLWLGGHATGAQVAVTDVRVQAGR